ncbi:uncharacterized protein LOC134775365 isoform X1 [Penaeus indicus]|uniref:uncharacterized protein LOC134775365 isoform X1 n=1 Tax=Penaeus indicus TaxID=29960 RepID=UPI00300CBB8D
MAGKSFVFVVIEILACCASFSAAKCEPTCQGHVAGDNIPDPLNCHQFYICLDTLQPTPAPFACPDGEDFDSVTLSCMSPSDPNYVCDRSCFVCAYECGSKPLVSDPWDCSMFYECTEGVAGQAMKCSHENPFFDGYVCQDDEDKCCSCIAYCSTGDLGRYIPDPQNCRGYYQCLNRGPAQEAHHSYCTAGHFDYLHQKCSITFPCFGLCYSHPPEECIETFVCESEGFFPKCPTMCDPSFYECSVNDVGFVVEAKQCPDGMLFDPVTSTCVHDYECQTSFNT